MNDNHPGGTAARDTGATKMDQESSDTDAATPGHRKEGGVPERAIGATQAAINRENDPPV